MYIENVLGTTLKHLSTLGGVALRGTFIAESFMKQFKPMNILGMLTQGWPIIGGIVQRKIKAKEQSDAVIKRAIYESSKEKKTTELSALHRKLEGEEDEQPAISKTGDRGADIGQDDQTKTPEEIQRRDLFATKKEIEKPLATKMAGSMVGSKVSAAAREERVEETEEERMDLFKKIEENTKATAEALGDPKKGLLSGIAGFFGGKGGGIKKLLMGGGAMAALVGSFSMIITGIAAILPYLLIAGVIAGAIWIAYKYVKENGGLGMVWDKFTKVIEEMFDKMGAWFKTKLTEMLNFFQGKWEGLKEYGEEKVEVAKTYVPFTKSSEQRDLEEVDAYIAKKQEIIKAKESGLDTTQLEKEAKELRKKVDWTVFGKDLGRFEIDQMKDQEILDWKAKSISYKAATAVVPSLVDNKGERLISEFVKNLADKEKAPENINTILNNPLYNTNNNTTQVLPNLHNRNFDETIMGLSWQRYP